MRLLRTVLSARLRNLAILKGTFKVSKSCSQLQNNEGKIQNIKGNFKKCLQTSGKINCLYVKHVSELARREVSLTITETARL